MFGARAEIYSLQLIKNPAGDEVQSESPFFGSY